MLSTALCLEKTWSARGSGCCGGAGWWWWWLALWEGLRELPEVRRWEARCRQHAGELRWLVGLQGMSAFWIPQWLCSAR